MIFVIPFLISSIINTALATFVWLRHRQTRLGQTFLAVVLTLLVLGMANLTRQTMTEPGWVYASSVVTSSLLALLSLNLLLFLAALYAPEWWRHPAHLRLIAAPYLGALALLLLDGLSSARLIVSGVEFAGTPSVRVSVGPLGRVFVVAFGAAWVPHIVVLVQAFVRQPEQRRPLTYVLLGMFLSGTFSVAQRFLPSIGLITNVVSQVSLVAVLSYLLLRRRIFETTRVAMDQALESLVEGIAVVGPDGDLLYGNPAISDLLQLRAGQRLGGEDGAGGAITLLLALSADERCESVLEVGERAVAVTVSPIRDEDGQVQGRLLLARDVTQAQSYERTLQERQAELLQTVHDLQQAQAAQRELSETLSALSLPIIPVAQGVIVLPLIGVIDERRAGDLARRFLDGVQAYQAHTVLIDLTGVPLLDRPVAQTLLNGVRSMRLLGARSVLVGIRPEIAELIVALGLDLSVLHVAPTLQEALVELGRARPRNLVR